MADSIVSDQMRDRRVSFQLGPANDESSLSGSYGSVERGAQQAANRSRIGVGYITGAPAINRSAIIAQSPPTSPELNRVDNNASNTNLATLESASLLSTSRESVVSQASNRQDNVDVEAAMRDKSEKVVRTHAQIVDETTSATNKSSFSLSTQKSAELTNPQLARTSSKTTLNTKSDQSSITSTGSKSQSSITSFMPDAKSERTVVLSTASPRAPLAKADSMATSLITKSTSKSLSRRTPSRTSLSSTSTVESTSQISDKKPYDLDSVYSATDKESVMSGTSNKKDVSDVLFSKKEVSMVDSVKKSDVQMKPGLQQQQQRRSSKSSATDTEPKISKSVKPSTPLARSRRSITASTESIGGKPASKVSSQTVPSERQLKRSQSFVKSPKASSSVHLSRSVSRQSMDHSSDSIDKLDETVAEIDKTFIVSAPRQQSLTSQSPVLRAPVRTASKTSLSQKSSASKKSTSAKSHRTSQESIDALDL
jgi:hypothetical protein